LTSSDGDVFQLFNTSAGYSGAGYMVVPNGRGTGGTGTALIGTGEALVFHVKMNQVAPVFWRWKDRSPAPSPLRRCPVCRPNTTASACREPDVRIVCAKAGESNLPGLFFHQRGVQ